MSNNLFVASAFIATLIVGLFIMAVLGSLLRKYIEASKKEAEVSDRFVDWLEEAGHRVEVREQRNPVRIPRRRSLMHRPTRDTVMNQIEFGQQPAPWED